MLVRQRCPVDKPLSVKVTHAKGYNTTVSSEVLRVRTGMRIPSGR